LSEQQHSFERKETPAASNRLPEEGLAAEDADEAFLQAARLAERRGAEIAAAIVALGADDEAIRARLEKRLSQRYDQLRERLVLSSTQTLKALDRALEAARAAGADALVADVTPARALLAAILRDEHREMPLSETRPNIGVAPLSETRPNIGVPPLSETRPNIPVAAATLAEQTRHPAPLSPQDTMDIQGRAVAAPPAVSPRPDDGDDVNATLVVADSSPLFVRPSPREDRAPPAAKRPARVPPAVRATPPAVRATPPAVRATPAVAPLPPPVPPENEPPPRRAPDRRGLLMGLGIFAITAAVSGALALRPRVEGPQARPLIRIVPIRPRPSVAGVGSPAPAPSPTEDIIIVPGRSAEAGRTPPSGLVAPPARETPPGGETGPATTAGGPPFPPPPVATSLTDLMAEGAQALARKDYDTALARYAAALAIDPGNAEATVETLRAKGGRAALGRFFETQATVRDIPKADEKQCEWGPCAKARVLDCKLEYAITPAVPVQGEPFRIDVSAVNIGEKNLKIQSPTAVMFRNGAQRPHPIQVLRTEITRGEKKLIARVEDVWTLGTTSWWLEVTVQDQKGDSYRAQFTWELPRALSR
jgi:hypothetical protein